jgi:hypothetical protein
MTSSMGTGSDTRMYSPRSESDHLYTDGEDYRHGKGSPEEQDKLTDKKIQEKDEQVKTRELPHLKFNIEQSEPDMGMPMPMPPEEPQEDMMEETPMANQAELSDITGSPGTGSPEASISFGAQALSPYGQQTIMASEPMEIAFQLLKREGDFSTEQFRAPPGGRSRQKQATSMRAKRQARTLSPRTEKGGMVNADKAVDMSHLGLSTKQPLRLFPDKYRQSLGTRAMQANRGNIAMPYQGHNIERRTPFKPMAIKSELQEVQTLLKSASGYLHLSQLRNILRDLKRAIAHKESTKKAPPSGKGSSKEGEAGHRDGETTQPQGGTDNKEADEFRSAGASGHHFVSRGSGRTA